MTRIGGTSLEPPLEIPPRTPCVSISESGDDVIASLKQRLAVQTETVESMLDPIGKKQESCDTLQQLSPKRDDRPRRRLKPSVEPLGWEESLEQVQEELRDIGIRSDDHGRNLAAMSRRMEHLARDVGELMDELTANAEAIHELRRGADDDNVFASRSEVCQVTGTVTRLEANLANVESYAVTTREQLAEAIGPLKEELRVLGERPSHTDLERVVACTAQRVEQCEGDVTSLGEQLADTKREISQHRSSVTTTQILRSDLEGTTRRLANLELDFALLKDNRASNQRAACEGSEPLKRNVSDLQDEMMSLRAEVPMWTAKQHREHGNNPMSSCKEVAVCVEKGSEVASHVSSGWKMGQPDELSRFSDMVAEEVAQLRSSVNILSSEVTALKLTAASAAAVPSRAECVGAAPIFFDSIKHKLYQEAPRSVDDLYGYAESVGGSKSTASSLHDIPADTSWDTWGRSSETKKVRRNEDDDCTINRASEDSMYNERRRSSVGESLAALSTRGIDEILGDMRGQILQLMGWGEDAAATISHVKARVTSLTDGFSQLEERCLVFDSEATAETVADLRGRVLQLMSWQEEASSKMSGIRSYVDSLAAETEKRDRKYEAIASECRSAAAAPRKEDASVVVDEVFQRLTNLEARVNPDVATDTHRLELVSPTSRHDCSEVAAVGCDTLPADSVALHAALGHAGLKEQLRRRGLRHTGKSVELAERLAAVIAHEREQLRAGTLRVLTAQSP